MNDIKPMRAGISFKTYLAEIFSENGEKFSKMLCENKLNIETERSIIFDLKDGFGNDRQLEIILRDMD